MTAGPFIMTNLEGLFSPFRDLEVEMDELRTMRRVSQIWEEMERREQGAWMMFGRFFDRQIDEMNRMTSSAWHSGMFSHPRLGSRLNHSFGNRDSPSNKEQSNVIVEFPDDREIKITLEEDEPSVVITEVEDTPDPSPMPNECPSSGFSECPTSGMSERPASGMSNNSSPIRKSSLINHDNDYIKISEPESKSSFHVSSVSKAKVEQSHSVETVSKTEKVEKKLKKVDFSKMEVHFEPGSGKVNIVETNEKPPSNQLFRRKRRHREKTVRSESPKANCITSSESGLFENISSDSVNYSDRLGTSFINSNIQITKLQNDLDLSIFNLRNTLFKNSLNSFSSPKNVLTSSSPEIKNENMYTSLKKNNVPTEKILSDKNVSSNYKSYTKTFNVSSKLQDMIQNSVRSQLKLVKTHVVDVEEMNVDSPEKLKILDSKSQNVIQSFRSVSSPSNPLKGRNSSLKRTNSRGKELTENSNLYSSYRSGSKLTNDDKTVSKVKSVNKSDSFKRNRVTRQESIKSTSSRGSINNETRLCQKKNNQKDSFKKDSNTKINRTPSIGKITTNSLKKGGIYVDGRPKKTNGATVTVISFSNNNQTPKGSESPEKNNFNNAMINNASNARNRLVKKDSLRSYCSKESLTSSLIKTAQNKKENLRDLSQNDNSLKLNENVIESVQTNIPKSNHSFSDYAHLKFNKTASDNMTPSKNAIYRNISVHKQDSLNSESGSKKSERIIPIAAPRTRRVTSDLNSKHLNDYENNLRKNSLDKKQFNHQNTSLFQPIKKERSTLSTKSQSSEIKTPVAIRKRSSINERKQSSPLSEKLEVEDLPLKNIGKNSNEKADYLKFTKSPLSKLSLTSLRRSKEPLRSFEKISNGWVGRCNMTALGEMRSETKWGCRRMDEMKITSHLNNLGEKNKENIRDASPVSQSSVASRVTEHHQKEAMIRLSRGYPSRKLDSPSTSYLKQNIETRKRSRNVYTPSSISSQSSNIPVVSKRRPAQFVRSESIRSDTPVPSEPIYETLNSRRKTPTALVKRNRHSNTCCNI